MFQSLIPSVYAQGAAAVTSAKNAGSGGEGGLTDLVRFVVTHLDNWIGGILVLFLFYILARMASHSARERMLKSKGEEVPENVLVLVERITKIAVLSIGIVIAGAINGINLGTVIGAISLGIGFAIKDIIGNFISSIVMLAQNRIRIGDFIQIGDILGTIVSIDTRVTILQAIDGTQVVIPNQTMLNQAVISYSTNPFRRLQVIVGVDYSTDLALVSRLIKGVLDKHPDVVPKPASTVLVNEFGESSINLMVFFWIESRKNWQQIRSNVAYRVRKALAEAGVNIPFPIRTLKLDENDRAFLKTMDSLKKGTIPEPREWPSDDMLNQIAAGTESLATIPVAMFSEKEGAYQKAHTVKPSDTPPPPAIGKIPAPPPGTPPPPSIK